MTWDASDSTREGGKTPESEGFAVSDGTEGFAASEGSAAQDGFGMFGSGASEESESLMLRTRPFKDCSNAVAFREASASSCFTCTQKRNVVEC